jgi:hypothetical protein
MLNVIMVNEWYNLVNVIMVNGIIQLM